MIGIYIPTLGRKHVLKRLVDNIRAATVSPHRIIFICENHDQDSIDEARKWGDRTLVNHGDPGYNHCIQLAYESDDSAFFVGANDDFDFQTGWDTEAMKIMDEPGVQAVGINDGSPNCGYTTISLIDRTYIQVHSGVVDMENRVQYPYNHNYADTEFYCTALMRGVFKPAPLSVIRHMHPDFGHGQYDKTYMKNRATMGRDAQTFESRRHLWT